MKTTVLTRQELYDLVWSTPRTKLAKTMHVSDVAIGKACARHDVPMPPRGHWAKPDTKRKKRPLPAPKPGAIDHIELKEAPARYMVSPADVGVPVVASVLVQPTLSKPHHLVSATLSKAKGAAEFSGKLVLAGPNVLNLRVHPTGLDRGLRIFDAVIKAAEAIGAVWSVADKQTRFTYQGHGIRVSLKQILKKGPPPPPPPPSKPIRGRTEPNWSYMFLPTYTWEPTQHYEFEIESYVPPGSRRRWRGTEAKPLESMLTEVVRSLPVAATLAGAHSKALKDHAAASEARYQRQIATAVERERTRLVRAKLVAAATQFSEAQAIRQLCDELEKLVAQQEEADPTGTRSWIHWARAEADSHDPTLGDRATLLDASVTVPPEFKHGIRRQLGYYEEE